MNNIFLNSSTLGVALSLSAYQLGTWIKKKTSLSIANPLLISILIILSFLLLFHIDYDSYNASAKYLSYLFSLLPL